MTPNGGYNVRAMGAPHTFSSQDSVGLPLRSPEPGKRLTLGSFLRTRLITGLLVAFPLVVSIFFGRFLFDLLDRWADPLSVALFNRRVIGVGVTLALLIIFVLGVLAHNVIGRRVLRFGERLFARIPVLRPVYAGAREVTRAFASNRARGFRRVVLVPFPYQGVRAVAFVTGEFDEWTPEGSRRMVTVFLPTSPNPTTGFFLVYPIGALTPTDLGVEEALHMVISGGLVSAAQSRMFPAGPMQKSDSAR
jgi:uncharacterized membrane protein